MYLPDQVYVEKDKDFYRACVYAIADRYSRNIYSMYNFTGTTGENNGDIVLSMEDQYKYYYGEQVNKYFEYLTQNENGGYLTDAWIPGKKIKSIIDFVWGNFIDIVQNMQMSVYATGRASEKKQNLYKRAMMETYLQDMIAALEQQMNVHLETIPGKRFSSIEELDKWMETDYKDEGAIHFHDIVDDVKNRCKFSEQAKINALHSVIAGFCNTKVDENGAIRIIHPAQSIVDFDNANRYFFNRRYGGEVEWLSLEQIIDIYGMSDAEIRELQERGGSSKGWGSGADPVNLRSGKKAFSGGFLYPTMFRPNGSKHQLYPVISCEWESVKKTEYQRTASGFRYAGEKQGDSVRTVRKATLIGDTILKDYGEKELYIEGENNISYMPFAPNAIGGKITSLVSQLHRNQDTIDSYKFKMRQAMRRDKGVFATYDLAHMNLKKYSKEALRSEMESLGIIFYDSSTGEAGDVLQRGQKFVERVDLSLSGSVRYYMEMIADEIREMETAVNIPNIAQGQQERQVGKAVQENTISLSQQGTMYMYDGYIKYMEEILHYSGEIVKATHKDTFKKELVLGDRGRKFLSVTKRSGWKDHGLYFKVNDYIDMQGRMELKGYAFASVQAGLLDMKDFVAIRRAKTYQEMEEVFTNALKQKEQREDLIREQQAMIEELQNRNKELERRKTELMKQESQNFRNAQEQVSEVGRQQMKSEEKTAPSR